MQNDHFFANVHQFAVVNFGLCELKHISCQSDDGRTFLRENLAIKTHQRVQINHSVALAEFRDFLLQRIQQNNLILPIRK